VTDQFVNGCGEKPNYVRGAFVGLELRRVDPVAGKVGVIIDAKTICKDNVFKAAGLSDVFIL